MAIECRKKIVISILIKIIVFVHILLIFILEECMYNLKEGKKLNTGCGKSRFTVICMENNTIISNDRRINSFTYYCKPTFAIPYRI